MNKSKKNTLLFLLGKLVSLFGTRIYGFAMSLYILKTTGSAFNFAISILVSTIPTLIITPIGGVIADRFDRKRIVLVTDFLSGIIMFIAFFLSQVYGLQIWIIYGSSVLLAIMNSLFTTSFDAALPNLVDEDRLGQVNSYNQAINSVSSIVAPVLGGAVYALVSPELFIIGNGISFILSTFSEAFIDFYYRVEKKTKNIVVKQVKLLDDLKEGLAYLKTQEAIMAVIKAALVLNFIFTAVTIAIPHILVVQFDISNRAFGIVEAMFSIGSLLVSVAFARKLGEFKPKRLGLLTISLGLLCGFFAIPLVFESLSTIPYFIPVFYGLMFFTLGSLLVIINIPFMTYIQQSADDQYRGRVMSLLTTIASAITPLGILIHGILLDYVATYIIIIYAGVGLSLIGVYIFVKLLKTPINVTAYQEEPAMAE